MLCLTPLKILIPGASRGLRTVPEVAVAVEVHSHAHQRAFYHQFLGEKVVSEVTNKVVNIGWKSSV